MMDCRNEKSSIDQKNFERNKRERLRQKLELVSLKNVSLEARRKEAKKPLFLTRYE